MRFVLLVINSVLPVFSLVLIIMGSLHNVYIRALDELKEAQRIGFLMMFTGCWLLVVAIIGSITSFNGHKKLFILYGIVLIVTHLLQITMGLMVVLEVLKLNYFVDNKLEQKFRSYYGETEINETGAAIAEVDQIQQEWACCGFWNVTPPVEDWPREVLPDSCCSSRQRGVNCAKNKSWRKNCKAKGNEIFSKTLNTIGAFAILFALGEFFLAWWSFYTAQKKNTVTT